MFKEQPEDSELKEIETNMAFLKKEIYIRFANT